VSTTTAIDITDGYIAIDYATILSNPISKTVYIPATASLEITGLSSSGYTLLLADEDGNITQKTNALPTAEERVTKVIIGSVSHIEGSGVIESVEPESSTCQNPMARLANFMQKIGILNNGVAIAAASDDLSIAHSAGVLTDVDSGLSNTSSDDIIVEGVSPVLGIIYSTRTGWIRTDVGTVPSPPQFDVAQYNPTGDTLSAIPGNNAYCTINRIFMDVKKNIIVQYGQVAYATRASAVEALSDGLDAFELNPTLRGITVALGALIAEKGADDLSDPADRDFIPADKFGNLVGGSAVASVVDLQKAYENGTQPQIVTDALRLALQFKDGTGVLANAILEVLDNSDNKVLEVNSQEIKTHGNLHFDPALTGVLTGGRLTASGTTDVAVTLGTGKITNFYDDYKTPVNTPVVWSADTITIPNLATDEETHIYINSSGVISTQSAIPTKADLRTKIFLGFTINNNATSQISAVIEAPAVIGLTAHAFDDYMGFIGATSRGGTIAKTADPGTNGDLAMKVDAHSLFYPGVNWHT
jgi:hypothetical protein